MVMDIRERIFLPDLSRSGRLAKKPRISGSPLSEKECLVQSAWEVDLGAVPAEASLQDEEVLLTADNREHPVLGLPSFSSDDEDDGHQGSSDSSSSGSEADSVATLALSKSKPAADTEPGPVTKFICHTSQFLHIKLDTAGNKFRCGRAITKSFSIISSERAALLLKCSQCFPK